MSNIEENYQRIELQICRLTQKVSGIVQDEKLNESVCEWAEYSKKMSTISSLSDTLGRVRASIENIRSEMFVLEREYERLYESNNQVAGKEDEVDTYFTEPLPILSPNHVVVIADTDSDDSSVGSWNSVD